MTAEKSEETEKDTSTRMLYRPATDQKYVNKLPLIKTSSLGMPLDAVIVTECDKGEYLKTGWFENPKDLMAAPKPAEPDPEPESKPAAKPKAKAKAKANDDSSKAS